MPKYEQAGVVYGPNEKKPTVEELEKEAADRDMEITNRPDGNMIISTKELPKELKKDDRESMEETLRKHGIDSVR